MDRNIKTLVAVNGQGGYDSYRAPSLAVTADGTLFVCYEGRQRAGDCRTLLFRRSGDGGRTFSTQEVLQAPAGGELLHNPIPLARRSGELLLFWCQDYARLFLRRSGDSGHAFGPVRELTGVIDGFRKIWPVTLWSLSPGHGVEMSDGTLVVPLWLSRGEGAHLPACFACIYSRDGGENWLCSNVAAAGNGVGDPTEASIAERQDGTLLATMRHEIPGVRCRAFCQGGPEHWSDPWLNHALPDPICSGALLSLGGGRMVFSNCAYGDEPALERQRQGEPVRWSPDARQRLTVRLSRDDGVTWSDGLLLEQESGASDLGCSPDGQTVYCFYEQGWSEGNCIFNRNLTLAALPVTQLDP